MSTGLASDESLLAFKANLVRLIKNPKTVIVVFIFKIAIYTGQKIKSN